MTSTTTKEELIADLENYVFALSKESGPIQFITDILEKHKDKPSIYEQVTKIPSGEELKSWWFVNQYGYYGLVNDNDVRPRGCYWQGNLHPTREKAEQAAAKNKALATIRRYVELVNDSEVNDGLCSMFVRISEYETVTFIFTDENSMNQFRKDCANELAILRGE